MDEKRVGYFTNKTQRDRNILYVANLHGWQTHFGFTHNTVDQFGYVHNFETIP